MQLVTNPDFNIGGRDKSRKQFFEGNGSRGESIFRHPHFLKYLRYFILSLQRLKPAPLACCFMSDLKVRTPPTTAGNGLRLVRLLQAGI